MHKRNIAFLIVAVLIALAIFFYLKPANTPEEPSVNPETMGTAAPHSGARLNKAAPPPPMDAAVPTGTAAGFLPTQMEDPKKFAAYQRHLQEMASCLNMKISALDPQAEINFENFNAAISADLGDVVAQSDEWFTVDLKTPAGEVRRIYVENSGQPGGEASRTLKYSVMGPGGAQKEIPLAAEQANNPTDTLIASLESDGSIIGKANSRRIFYQNGDDLLLVERDGKMYSFELPHDGKVFTCTGADSAVTMSCSCK
ncbi:MAG: hypothetical protein OM95_05665 [Bdellovibrio sp. ArHS]|uniref:hypothetical protein n=1 Tax=Bdellovibrio sp. ArHS TaxID=1569284 RepID=UPI0005837F11|nr:hypothetical protein [Bdellovibrio sp. ArHS]KHD88955.1 MAG: hypothetical protein OM95_05665 [Bdellovibrio sp. ArHS]